MILLLRTLLLIIFAFPAYAFTGTVARVIDGDTIAVQSDHQQYRIRLYAIDAPEKHQAFGISAKDCAASLALGKTVAITEHGHDRYGRIIGDVVLPDGRDMNQEIVRAGFAFWYRKYAPHDTLIERLEIEARAGRRGLWADEHPEPPWEFRQAQRRHSVK